MTRNNRLFFGVAAVCFLIACGQQAAAPAPVGQAAKGDGADDALAKRYGDHTVFDAPQEISVKYLRQLVCAAVADKHPWGSAQKRAEFRMRCNDQTVVSIARTAKWSSKLFHDDGGKALTMKMAIKVTDGDKTFEATLQRRYSPRVFKLYWQAVYQPDVDHNDFIDDLADDLGEYLDYPGGPWDSRLQPVTLADLPPELQATADAKVMEIHQGLEEDDSAGLYDDGILAILDAAGAIIGYIVPVEFYMEHPLFDGGGVRLYYNLDGDLITEVEWWG